MIRGFTLAELMMTVALLALVSGIVAPRLRRPLDRLALERASYDVTAAHVRARMTAITRNRTTLLGIAPDSIRIRVLAGRDTVAYWARGGPAAHGVTLAGPGYWLRFHPAGVGMGPSNGTWILRRGRMRRTVIVSRLGRLRVTTP